MGERLATRVSEQQQALEDKLERADQRRQRLLESTQKIRLIRAFAAKMKFIVSQSLGRDVFQ